MKQEIRRKLLKKVKEDYDKIALEFSESRSYIWKDLEIFKDYIKPGDKVLDLGCGNGRVYDLLRGLSIYPEQSRRAEGPAFGSEPRIMRGRRELGQGIDYFGIDNSQNLIKEAQKKYPGIADKFQVGDALDLNFPDNQFDVVIMVAVLNHIPSKELRLKVLNDVKRVLKPGGHLLMTNWNLYQKKYWPLVIKYTLKKLFGKSKMDWGDCFVPFGKERIERYYHISTKREIKKLAKQTGFKVLINNYIYKGKKSNWWRGWNTVSILKGL